MWRGVLTVVTVAVALVAGGADGRAAAMPTLMVSPDDGSHIPPTGVIATRRAGSSVGWLRTGDGRRVPASPNGLIWYADLPAGPVAIEWQAGDRTITAATLIVDPTWRAPAGPVRLEAFLRESGRWDRHDDSGLEVRLDHEIAAVIFVEALLPGRREHLVVASGAWATVPDDCGLIVGVEVLDFDGQRRPVAAGGPAELARTLYLPRIGQHPERILGGVTLLLVVLGIGLTVRRVLAPDPVAAVQPQPRVDVR